MIDESILSRINEQISPISSPSSTFSQEVLTPASSHCRGVRVSQASTPSSPSSELKTILDNRRDDAVPVAEIGERKLDEGKGEGKGDSGGSGNKRKRLELEEITRFTMVKRIW